MELNFRATATSKLYHSRPKKRSTNACLACRARKVRCDVSHRGRPCMNCHLDEKECIVKSSRRGWQLLVEPPPSRLFFHSQSRRKKFDGNAESSKTSGSPRPATVQNKHDTDIATMKSQLKEVKELPMHRNLSTQLQTTVKSPGAVDGARPPTLTDNPARIPEVDGNAIFHGNLVVRKMH